MRFKAKPVHDLTDVTLDLEQLEVQGIFNDTALGGALSGKLPKPTLTLVTASAWVAPTLINAWTNFGGAFETAGYLKDPFGFVHLKGLITGGATGTVAFVLPAGFRPGATAVNPPAMGVGITGNVQTSVAGNVLITISGATNIGLSGITFLAEN